MSGTKSGTRMVIGLVTATVAALGVATVWAPFYADRDKLRGMSEDADGGMSEMEKKQYQEYIRQIQMAQAGGGKSMWSNMDGKQQEDNAK